MPEGISWTEYEDDDKYPKPDSSPSSGAEFTWPDAYPELELLTLDD